MHLNELSPDDARDVPGFVYQLGNLIASVNAPPQAGIAVRYGGNYARATASIPRQVPDFIALRAIRPTSCPARSGARSLPRSAFIGKDHFTRASGPTVPLEGRWFGKWSTAKKIEARQRKIASAD